MREDELKLALAKMLPENLYQIGERFWWKNITPRNRVIGASILDTEWLHVCWLIEQTLTPIQLEEYGRSLNVSSSWQRRAEALIKL